MYPPNLILVLCLLSSVSVSVNGVCPTPYQCNPSGTLSPEINAASAPSPDSPALKTARSYFSCVNDAIDTTNTNYYTCPLGQACISTLTTGLPGVKGASHAAPVLSYNGPCAIVPAAAACTAAKVGTSIGAGFPACTVYFFCNAADTAPAGPYTCPTGQHFSNTTKGCAPAAEAGCDPSLSTAATNSTSPATNGTTPLASNGTTPSGQTNATESSSSSASTPAGGNSTTAAPSSTGSTVRTTQPPPECEGPGRLPDPNSCRHFFRCNVFGRRSRARCPFRFRFDADAGRCRARNVECGDRPLV